MEWIDRMPMGEPETTVAWPDRRLLGLRVRGADTSELGMLAIRCAIGVHGQDLPLGLAITEGPLNITPSQSNPRRDVEDDDHA